MTGNTKKTSQSGFTLIEMLVVTAVFVVIFTLIADLAIIFTKNPEKMIREKELEREADYCLEFIAQKIRLSAIDYQTFLDAGINLSTSNPTSSLFLLDSNGESIHFEQVTASGLTSLLYFSETGDDAKLNASNFNITNLDFYVYPASDPYAEGSSVNEQPRVTISLQANHAQDSSITINIQTTITSRVYER